MRLSSVKSRKTFWGGVRIVSSIQFGRVEIPKGGHKVSKGGGRGGGGE